MTENRYSLNDLADSVGIEPRTIRSYIERGLLPGAQERGRAASYSEEHLSRLEVIKSLRRARPTITLSEIRIFLEGLDPERLRALASGSITATAPRIIESVKHDDIEITNPISEDEDEIPRMIDWERSAARLTGAGRLVLLLRELSGIRSPASTAKMEMWQRIPVTPDVELSVRAEFDANQLAAFKELADLLRHLLQHPNALSSKGDE
jgi:DNA-binding transcriptional MerR regulator